MSDTPVRVRQLRLRCGRDAPAAGLRARVEDALRTSSKPPALAHRFVLVRRLRLRLPATVSAQGLALQLEAQWRALEALAQPLEHASDAAEAVWAIDEVQARLLLLQRWLAGAPATAWFWQRLLPDIDAHRPAVERVRQLLFTPLATAEAGLEAVWQARLWQQAWLRVQAAGQGPALWAALPAAQAEALSGVLQGEAASQAAMRAALPRLRLAAMSTDDGVAGWAEGSPLAEEAQEAARRAAVEPTAQHAVETRAAVPPCAAPSSRPALGPFAGTSPASEGSPQGVTPLHAASHTAGQPQADAPQSLIAPQPAPDASMPEPSAWAGLWFLLPMLRRLRLHEAPDAERTLALLLLALAQRHRFDAPVQRWIAELAARSAAAQATASEHAAADAWQRSLRLHSLQATRLPLRRVLHRPGQLLLAPHRVDVLLPLAQADIRLRRAGFDIDPGYLPWLDTVVHFHYLR